MDGMYSIPCTEKIVPLIRRKKKVKRDETVIDVLPWIFNAKHAHREALPCNPEVPKSRLALNLCHFVGINASGRAECEEFPPARIIMSIFTEDFSYGVQFKGAWPDKFHAFGTDLVADIGRIWDEVCSGQPSRTSGFGTPLYG